MARFATIAPSGGSYTSLSAAEAGEQAIQANLVTSNETLELQYQGDWSGGADTTATTFNGFTTDSTHWIKVSCDPANTWGGLAWSTAKARLETGSALSISDDYVTIQGLQLHNTSTGTVVGSNNVGTLVDACHLRGRIGVGGNNAAAVINVRNSLGTDGSGSTMRRGINGNTSGALVRAHHFTYGGTASSSTDPGYGAAAGTTVITNNCLFKDTTAGAVGWGGAGTISGDYNASSDATAPGANSLQSRTFTFVNEAGGDYRLSVSDTSGAIGGGQDLRADANLPVVYDAGGNLRPAAPTIGMWEADPDTGVDPAEGDLSTTDPSDAFSGTASVGDGGTASADDATDAVTADGAMAAGASGAPVDPGDGATGSADVAASGSADVAEGPDGASGAGQVSAAADGAIQEPSDAAQGTAGAQQPTIDGDLSTSDASDGVDGSAAVGAKAAGAPDEGSDSAAAGAETAVEGSASAQDAPDTAGGAATVATVGEAPVTEPGDEVTGTVGRTALPTLVGAWTPSALLVTGEHTPSAMLPGGTWRASA